MLFHVVTDISKESTTAILNTSENPMKFEKGRVVALTYLTSMNVYLVN